MIPLSDVNFGPTDAAVRDEDFLNKFIEPPQIHFLFSEKYWIITGEKGAGKTAIRQAIKQKHFSEYSVIVDLDFDRMDFSALFQNLNQLSQVTNLQRLHLMTDYWQYALLVQVMRSYFEKHTNTINIDLSIVADYLKKKGLIKAGPLRTILNVIAECWSYIEKYTSPNNDNRALPFLPSDLSPEVVDTVSKYPMFDPNFMHIRKKFGKVLASTGQKILIILDGFDRFENKADRSSDINVIFESLVEAVYSLSVDDNTNSTIKIKALVPHDRYLSVFLRDTDKFDAVQKSIRWNLPNLEQFISQRIRLHPKLSQIEDFHHLWREIMPTKISNPVYNLEEDSFEYILRHTMYRPRQLQVHLEKLSSLYNDQNIDPSMIPRSIRESCRKLCTFYILEYYIDHPNLEEFIYRFKGKYNVMPYSEFKKIVEGSLAKFGIKDLSAAKKINMLYTMGFFGVLEFLDAHHERTCDEYHYLPPRKIGIAPYRIRFYYKSPQSRVSASLDDHDLIAIHPMFFDTANMKPHPDYIVG